VLASPPARMSLKKIFVVATLCGLGANACSASRPAASTAQFDKLGYVHHVYRYRVLSAAGADASKPLALLGDDWELDNLYFEGPRLKHKMTPEFLTTYRFDTDGDGAPDTDEKVFVYDLRFKHRARDALIFTRSLPIAGELRNKDLRVLAQRYFDAISGAGYEAVVLGGIDKVKEQRYAAEIVDKGPAQLAGREAYTMTFDVANVDQVKLTPNARHTRVQVAFVRAPFNYVTSSGAKEGSSYPVLLVAAYANLPEDFVTDLPDFEKLLGRLQIDDRAGFERLPVEASKGAAVAAGAAAPAAPASAEPASAAPTSVPPAP
jgi:hypothetical protein